MNQRLIYFKDSSVTGMIMEFKYSSLLNTTLLVHTLKCSLNLLKCERLDSYGIL